MNQLTPKDVAASVRSRLLNLARQTGRPFEEVLVLYGLERFLFRLSQSDYSDRFILKGGLLLIGMGFPAARPTRDMDFLALMSSNIDAVSRAIQEIGAMDANDGMAYDFSELRHETVSPNTEYQGIRFRFVGQLGQARIPMQIDIGFGDRVVPEPRKMAFPTLLDMDPPMIVGYSMETVVAEKFEAALDLADLNSRIKDFYDIWALSQKYPFDGPSLQEAITATCARRKTTISSEAEVFSYEFAERSDKNAQWSGFLKRSALADVPGDFVDVMEAIRRFLLPIALASQKNSPFQGTWPAGGPWQGVGQQSEGR
ncbi:MAG: nucleotidyl transferase AbiEii/AbiGii toxin family protein [Thermodesulfobacteriota bacterium]|nr:nucleotidyl transferase AbiEii/AbiGii toxin family protein [Thermodesulfobacteriota bacterium]